MPDAVAFGELLVDFAPTVSGVTLIEAPALVKAPGGAPANFAVARGAIPALPAAERVAAFPGSPCVSR